MMMDLAQMGRVGAGGGVKVGLQTDERLLGADQIAGLERIGQTGKVGVGAVVGTKRLSGRDLRGRLQGLLKGRERILGGGQIAGLERAAKGLEIPGERVGMMGRRGEAGYTHKVCR